jgi:hypothetical protein
VGNIVALLRSVRLATKDFNSVKPLLNCGHFQFFIFCFDDFGLDFFAGRASGVAFQQGSQILGKDYGFNCGASLLA